MRRCGVALVAAGLMGISPAGAAGAAGPESDVPGDDPYIWLESMKGAKVDAWVEAENAKTAAALEADPRFKQAYDDAFAVMSAKDRIPAAIFSGGRLDNFWQDADHKKGILRTTTLGSYQSADPQWRTLIDFDALSKVEGKSWVYSGLTCLPPDERLCLVALSDGGRDSIEMREFDMVEGKFVAGGFTLPEGRNFVSWIDRDHWLVSRDWGEGTMTPSNYPFILKRVTRGEPLAKAVEVYRATAKDTAVFPAVIRDSAGTVQAEVAVRYVTAFETAFYRLGESEPSQIDLPAKASFIGSIGGRMLVQIDQSWSRGGKQFPANSILSFDLDSWKRDPNAAAASLVWAAGPKQSLDGAGLTEGRLLVTYLDNVRGRAVVLTPVTGGGWTSAALDLPSNATLSLGSTNDHGAQAFVSITDFLTPSALYLVDTASAQAREIKTTPERFDSSKLVIEQHLATSKDGTRIPYFLVRPKGMKADGSTPTLLNGYGGFQVSQLPAYSGTVGKLWLERGNAFVVASLRGGGEFGPAWHEAGKGAAKQRTWDDFIAVAEDLIKRKVTSPRRLGVIGGSQGGLLVGTAITQHPELFSAAIVQVPLFDMLRYHLIGNGQSWAAEYGDPTKPEERAWVEAYSPYQKLSKAQARIYPFIETSAADDRVTPVHGRKAAARFAELGVPYYYFENREGGHAAAANIPEKARLTALEYIYAIRRLED
ncbi:MAG: prolyl oligopeptidase family serine peptidase [Sphingomicrobium sp.]